MFSTMPANVFSMILCAGIVDVLGIIGICAMDGVSLVVFIVIPLALS